MSLTLTHNPDGTWTLTIDNKTYTAQDWQEARKIIESEDV